MYIVVSIRTWHYIRWNLYLKSAHDWHFTKCGLVCGNGQCNEIILIIFVCKRARSVQSLHCSHVNFTQYAYDEPDIDQPNERIFCKVWRMEMLAAIACDRVNAPKLMEYVTRNKIVQTNNWIDFDFFPFLLLIPGKRPFFHIHLENNNKNNHWHICATCTCRSNVSSVRTIYLRHYLPATIH